MSFASSESHFYKLSKAKVVTVPFLVFLGWNCRNMQNMAVFRKFAAGTCWFVKGGGKLNWRFSCPYTSIQKQFCEANSKKHCIITTAHSFCTDGQNRDDTEVNLSRLRDEDNGR